MIFVQGFTKELKKIVDMCEKTPNNKHIVVGCLGFKVFSPT